MGETIWVIMQQRDGQLHRGSRETVAAAAALAQMTGGSITAVLLGSGIGELASEAAGSMGVSGFLVVDDPALEVFEPGAYVAALAPAITERRPDVVLFPHTYQSMDYFPRLAQAVGGAVISSVGSFRPAGDDVLWTRPILGGKLVAECKVKRDVIVLASIQSGSFSVDAVPVGSTEVTPLAAPGLEGYVPHRHHLGVEQAAEEEVDLSQASVIVAAGRGVGGADKMGVIEELAAALGAEIGASRPVIDNDWLPRDRQIGSSGQTVAPKLYVAAGVSGAIQHLVGMKGSGCVVAVNKDPNAPIFSVANYGVVGDLHEVLPAMTAAIREAKG